MRWTLSGLLALLLPAFAGCNDSTFEINPLLGSDTILVAAPLPQTVHLPTAIDLTGDGGGGIRGGRFPERVRDAMEWDLVVRIRNGELVLIPARGVGIMENRAAITPPLLGQTFSGLREVPGQSGFVSDSAIVMRVGNVHAARSRDVGGIFGIGCVQFAKLQPLEVDPVAGLLRVQIVTNERCGDHRLVPE